MKPKLTILRFSLAAATVLAISVAPVRAQNVSVTGTLTDVPAAGGVYDYTLSLQNIGSEPVESLWVGWIPGSFNVASPTAPGNLQGWSSTVDGSSVQYLGTSGTALPAGGTATFTFDSTTTPTQFQNQTGKAGQSTAYGINAANGQLSFTLSPPDTQTFPLQVQAVPEPSTLSLVAMGSVGLLGAVRRKISRARV